MDEIMIESIARQSVIIKCQNRLSLLLGNYEIMYAMGLLCKIAGKSITIKSVSDMYTDALDIAHNYIGKDEYEKQLIKMLKICEVEDNNDLQMTDMFNIGLNENNIWNIHI